MMSIAQIIRQTKMDQLPLIGPLIRFIGLPIKNLLYADSGVIASVDGLVDIRLSPKSFSGGFFSFDSKLTKELQHLAKPGRHFVDAGAHVGICSLLYAKLTGPETRIASFDPSPAIHPLLFDNARINGFPMETYRAALGDRSGTVSFFFDHKDPNASLSKDAPGKYWYWENREKPTLVECRVPMMTLDHFCNAVGFEPGLLKLDVEGAERLVLEGGRQTIQKYRPIIILETHVFAWESFGYTREMLEATIRELRYAIYDQDEKPFTGPLGTGPMRDNNHYILKPL